MLSLLLKILFLFDFVQQSQFSSPSINLISPIFQPREASAIVLVFLVELRSCFHISLEQNLKRRFVISFEDQRITMFSLYISFLTFQNFSLIRTARQSKILTQSFSIFRYLFDQLLYTTIEFMKRMDHSAICHR